MIYFKKIAELGSFIRAAEELYVTQPSLSYAIQLLERELEVPLFIRKRGKHLELTTYGRELLPYIEAALLNLDTGLTNIKQLKTPSGGVVRISIAFVSPIFQTIERLRELSDTLSSQHILVDISVSQSGNKFLQDLQKGNLDLVFSGISQADGIDSACIFPEDVVVLLPCDHPLAQFSALELEQVSTEPLIMYAQDMKFTLWLENLFKIHKISPNICKFSTDWSNIIVSILMRSGIAISPRLPVPIEQIAMVPLINPTDTHWSTYMMWPSNRKLSPAVRLVRDHFLLYQSCSCSSSYTNE